MVINAGSGLVLTNNHVIENATKITATVAATGQNFQAKVVGYDVTGDIALIQLQHPSGLHQVPLGDSGKVKTGDVVTALGNAEGQNEIVPATGHITGVNRSITASDQGGAVTSETLHGMLQTDAGIVSGDSGGPLVNAAGRVIGMDTAGNDVRFPDQQAAAGFAIPVNTALSVAREIAAGHASSTISIGYPPFIGIYVGQGTSSDPQQQAAAQQQQNNGFGGGGGFGGNGFGGNGSGSQSCYTNDSNLPVPSTIAPVSSGTLVIGTICGSPAAVAGVTAGSVITSVNGQAVGAPQSAAHAIVEVPARRHGVPHLGHPVRPAQDGERDPDRGPAPVGARPGKTWRLRRYPLAASGALSCRWSARRQATLCSTDSCCCLSKTGPGPASAPNLLPPHPRPTSSTPAPPVPDHTARMSRPRSSSDMAGTSTPYPRSRTGAAARDHRSQECHGNAASTRNQGRASAPKITSTTSHCVRTA